MPTASPASLAPVTAPSRSRLVTTAFLAIFPARTASKAILPVRTAFLSRNPVLTAFGCSCLGPTLLRGSWLAAIAVAPPSAMNRAMVAVTFA